MVLFREDVSQLIADKLRSSNQFVNTSVGVTVNPVLCTAFLDETVLVCNESPIDTAPFEIG